MSSVSPLCFSREFTSEGSKKNANSQPPTGSIQGPFASVAAAFDSNIEP
jgi:hypothetical protein